MHDQRIICILGAHRSGTSAITRGLAALGVDLGNRLLPPQPDNPKGFFEDQDIANFNALLLQDVGSDWHYMAAVDVRALLSEGHGVRRGEATALLREKLGGGHPLGLKDPRMSILLPFWLEVFGEIGVADSYVIAVRNPLEVVASLRKRDGVSHAKGLAIWAKHIIGALRNSAGRKRVFVAYDRLLANPLAELTRIASQLDLPLPKAESPMMTDFAERFLDEGLRHNRVTAMQLQTDSLPVPLLDLHVALQALATDVPESETHLATRLTNAVDWLRSIDLFLDHADAVEKLVSEAWAGQELLRRDAEQASLKVESLCAEIANKEVEFDAFAQRAHALQQVFVESTAGFTRQTLAFRRAASTSAAIADEHIRELNQLRANLDAERARSGSAEARNTMLVEENIAIGIRLRGYLDLNQREQEASKRNLELVKEAEVLSARLAERDSEVLKVKSALESCVQRTVELDARARGAESDLEAVRTSLFWRSTSPVRRVIDAVRTRRPRAGLNRTVHALVWRLTVVALGGRDV